MAVVVLKYVNDVMSKDGVYDSLDDAMAACHASADAYVVENGGDKYENVSSNKVAVVKVKEYPSEHALTIGENNGAGVYLTATKPYVEVYWHCM